MPVMNRALCFYRCHAARHTPITRPRALDGLAAGLAGFRSSRPHLAAGCRGRWPHSAQPVPQRHLPGMHVPRHLWSGPVPGGMARFARRRKRTGLGASLCGPAPDRRRNPPAGRPAECRRLSPHRPTPTSSTHPPHSTMPIYEYACGACHHQFETLVRSNTLPSCPQCASTELTKLLSIPAKPADPAGLSLPASPCGSCEAPGSHGGCPFAGAG